MTDSILPTPAIPPAAPSTPSTPSAADQLQRVEALRRRRAEAKTAPSGRRTTSRRSHPAGGSRIGVAGGALAAMLGLVAVFGLVEKSAGANPVAPVATTPSQVIVVIHRSGEAAGADGTGSTAVVSPASAPIALTARPIVTPASPVQQTPAGTTNGSR